MGDGPRQVGRFARSVYQQTLAGPVTSGRLRDVDWPHGLRAVVFAGYAMFGLAGVLVVTSAAIRRHSVLVLSANTGVGMPAATVWPMVVLLSFGVAAFMAAALHGPWWLKSLGLIFVLIVVGPWSLHRPSLAGSVTAPLAAGAAMVAAVVFVIVRWRRRFAWWEFAVLWGLVGMAMVIGVVEGRYSALFGQDATPAYLQLTAAGLGFLALPAATVAGASVAEVTVRATLAATEGAQRLAGQRWPYAILLAVLGVRAAQVSWQVAHRDPVVDGPASLVPAALLVAVFGVLGFIVLRIARRRQATVAVDDLAEELGRLTFGVAVALIAVLVPVQLIIAALQIALALDPTGSARQWTVDVNPLLTKAVDPIRALIGVVLIAFAVRAARRGQPSRALVLGCVGVMAVALARSMFLDQGTVATLSADAVNLVSTAVVLVAVGVTTLRRQLTSRRALAYAGVLILSALFSYRNFISDPVGALLGFSGAALVLFGLTWDLFTGSQWGNGESRRFGRSTRVLLVLTNSVLTMMVLAFAALIRDGSRTIYLDAYAELGDLVFGTALVAAAVIAVLDMAAHDRPVSGPAGVSSVDGQTLTQS